MKNSEKFNPDLIPKMCASSKCRIFMAKKISQYVHYASLEIMIKQEGNYSQYCTN